MSQDNIIFRLLLNKNKIVRLSNRPDFEICDKGTTLIVRFVNKQRESDGRWRKEPQRTHICVNSPFTSWSRKFLPNRT